MYTTLTHTHSIHKRQKLHTHPHIRHIFSQPDAKIEFDFSVTHIRKFQLHWPITVCRNCHMIWNNGERRSLTTPLVMKSVILNRLLQVIIFYFRSLPPERPVPPLLQRPKLTVSTICLMRPATRSKTLAAVIQWVSKCCTGLSINK